MMKCGKRQATDPQKLKKNCQQSFSYFLFVEAIGIEAEAIDDIAASTSWF